jgi:hypothetical protein
MFPVSFAHHPLTGKRIPLQSLARKAPITLIKLKIPITNHGGKRENNHEAMIKICGYLI